MEEQLRIVVPRCQDRSCSATRETVTLTRCHMEQSFLDRPNQVFQMLGRASPEHKTVPNIFIFWKLSLVDQLVKDGINGETREVSGE